MTLGSHNRSLIARLLEAGRHGTISLERRWPHLPAGVDAMTALQGRNTFRTRRQKLGTGAHTLRDKSQAQASKFARFSKWQLLRQI